MNIKKRITSFLLVLTLIISNLSFIVANALEENAYFKNIDKSEIIPYVYENQKVTKAINELIEKTETLKTKYDIKTAISIITEVRDITKNITKKDYENNYNILHDPNNYETGEFYKYKYSQISWIETNVMYLVISNSVNDIDNIKILLDLLYEASCIEMNNDCKLSDSVHILKNLYFIKDAFPENLKDFIDFTINKSNSINSMYEDGTKPTYVNLMKDYENVKKQEKDLDKKNKQESKKYKQAEDIKEEKKDTSSLKLNDFINNNKDNVVVNSSHYEVKNYNVNANQSYSALMDSIMNNSQVAVKTYSIKNIYYTLDKTVENPTWNDTGISITEEGISYSKLLNILSIIGRNDGYYFFEDSDMSMIIADNKNLVINNVENIKEEEISTLFDSFDKLGIKVMLKSDDTIDTSDSLTSKLEAGEINEISVNGKKLILTNKPILTKNVLQLPVIQVAKELGYDVNPSGNTITLTYEKEVPSNPGPTPENEEIIENESETIEVTTNKITIVLTVGSSNYTIDEVKNSFKTPVTKTNGVVYAEFDKIASMLGYSYSYNADTGVIEFVK